MPNTQENKKYLNNCKSFELQRQMMNLMITLEEYGFHEIFGLST